MTAYCQLLLAATMAAALVLLACGEAPQPDVADEPTPLAEPPAVDVPAEPVGVVDEAKRAEPTGSPEEAAQSVEPPANSEPGTNTAPGKVEPTASRPSSRKPTPPMAEVTVKLDVPEPAAASVSPPPAAPPPPCGNKGQPMCPLQAWMEHNLQTPYDEKDLPGLATALGKVARLVPDPVWNSGAKAWAGIANDAKAAARAGDFSTVRKSCKNCHRTWRKKYKDMHRHRPVP